MAGGHLIGQHSSRLLLPLCVDGQSDFLSHYRLLEEALFFILTSKASVDYHRQNN